MKPTAEINAVGFSIWGMGLRPGKVSPISQNFNDMTSRITPNVPRRPASLAAGDFVLGLLASMPRVYAENAKSCNSPIAEINLSFPNGGISDEVMR